MVGFYEVTEGPSLWVVRLPIVCGLSTHYETGPKVVSKVYLRLLQRCFYRCRSKLCLLLEEIGRKIGVVCNRFYVY